jgi:putative transposase
MWRRPALGLSHLAIDSSGKKTANPRFIKQAQKNLTRKQQSLSRKTKSSARRAKARLLEAKAHERAANARNDFQHKLSRQIVNDNQAVSVATLKVKNMMKNAKLAKHIGDASWHALITKLAYKAKEKGKHLVKIDQWFASKR